MERVGEAEASQERGQSLEVSRRDPRDEGGHGGGRGEVAEAELATEVRTGREGRMGFVIRPPFEGTEEEVPYDLTRFGGRATGGTGRTDRIG